MITLENMLKTTEGEFAEERRSMQERQKNAKAEILEKLKEIDNLRSKVNSDETVSKEDFDSLRDDLKTVQAEHVEATRQNSFLENKIKNLEKKLVESNKVIEEQKILAAGGIGRNDAESSERNGGQSPRRKQAKVDETQSNKSASASIPTNVVPGAPNQAVAQVRVGAEESVAAPGPMMEADDPPGADNDNQHEDRADKTSEQDMFETISDEPALEKAGHEVESRIEVKDDEVADVEELFSPAPTANSDHENEENGVTEEDFGSPFSDIQ